MSITTCFKITIFLEFAGRDNIFGQNRAMTEQLDGVFGISIIGIVSVDAGFDTAEEVVGTAGGIDFDLTATNVSLDGPSSSCFQVGVSADAASGAKSERKIGVGAAVGERQNKGKSVVVARAVADRVRKFD